VGFVDAGPVVWEVSGGVGDGGAGFDEDFAGGVGGGGVVGSGYAGGWVEGWGWVGWFVLV